MIHRPILIVDDEPQNLAALRQILAGHYSLVFARNGADAIAAAEKHNPSLILLDVQMPDMDGFEVCRKLKANPVSSGIPVIFVTSLAETGQEAKGFDVGAVDYIVKPVSPPIVRARVANHLSLVQSSQLERSYRDAISMLAEAGHFRDNDTGVHIWRMAAYASALAKALGWCDADCELLELAAPMHDTGKLGIPDAILLKPGALTEDEWEIMKTHPRIGYNILAKSNAPVFQLAAEVALRHHERWDGTGYPDGLRGEEIPESARIVAVADVFDALTMKRPYKEAWPLETTISHIRQGIGSHFDERIVETLISIMPQILATKSHWDSRAGQASPR